MKVLVIEDEQQVSSFIKQGLEEHSFAVDVAFDGNMGERLALNRDYDVIVLDLVIPGINGFDLCKILKKEKPSTPVIMLTTLGTTADKLSGFDAGADDYLLKPFAFEELVARLRALMRRRSATTDYGNVLRFEDLKLDIEKKVAHRHDKVIKLSAKEFALLEFFLRNPERVISRSELAEKIWDIKFETGTNVVEVYMNMLRNKIDRDFEPKLLQTRIGLGYVLSKET
ncbi:DNA-binding response regulator, OmpR family, contains REC and winged-helix (wHTH) domain [Chryseolinea serpens]|uniref:DNA-binding response regulator, OmpR family, contains REC and winged-helix (WHTH) domain n=1 Tax=Chryseolinea serpens TaxID=947013 RepID=A0A1M5RCT4_9BACT|nr:response regulator transcription factor [Chryseolinea serpens]SHH24157.1 DNA-binding response regulator, OmpR family, contains REC and winged-helix (wHTH) domain [Chryseolinea serpens]